MTAYSAVELCMRVWFLFFFFFVPTAKHEEKRVIEVIDSPAPQRVQALKQPKELIKAIARCRHSPFLFAASDTADQ